MGLVGIVDPTHEERKADTPGRLPRWFPVDELLDRFLTAPPKYSPWTWELVQAALEEWQTRDYISTTMLVGGCARSKVLERKEDFVLALDDLYASLAGTMTHRTLEYTARPGSLAEARFFTEVMVPKAGPVEVSCSPDLITVNPNAVVDYKKPADDRGIPVYGYVWDSHELQLQLNRYIVNHATKWNLKPGSELTFNPRELVFEHLYIVYLGSRWPKVIELQKSIERTFKNGREGKLKVPDVWDDNAVVDVLVPRLTGMVKALSAYPEWPEGLEEYPGFEGEPGWRCPGKPWCKLPDCLAKRYPNGLVWESPPEKRRRSA